MISLGIELIRLILNLKVFSVGFRLEVQEFRMEALRMPRTGRPKKPKGTQFVILTVTVPPQIKKALQERARTEGKALSKLVHEALSKFLEPEK